MFGTQAHRLGVSSEALPWGRRLLRGPPPGGVQAHQLITREGLQQGSAGSGPLPQRSPGLPLRIPLIAFFRKPSRGEGLQEGCAGAVPCPWRRPAQLLGFTHGAHTVFALLASTSHGPLPAEPCILACIRCTSPYSPPRTPHPRYKARQAGAPEEETTEHTPTPLFPPLTSHECSFPSLAVAPLRLFVCAHLPRQSGLLC